jgi:phospholipid N-methyltransferase
MQNVDCWGLKRMRFVKFIVEFLKYPKQVGALAESSPFLARKMAQQINGAINIVEFGSGTGSVTMEILRHLPENGRLTCLGINPCFCEHLKTIKDSRLKVINDDVQNCNRYIDYSDCILSSLPLGIFDESKREKILALSRKSKTYIQFQYTPFLRAKLKRHFRDVKMKFVLLNFPPAFIYISSNPTL